MDVQLLAHESVDLVNISLLPGHVTNVLASEHVAARHRIPIISMPRPDLARSFLILGVWPISTPLGAITVSLAFLWAARPTLGKPPAVGGIVLLAGLVVAYTALLLCLFHRTRGIDAVIIAQVVEADVVQGIVPLSRDGLVDAVPATTDAVVLELHDGAGAERAVGV